MKMRFVNKLTGQVISTGNATTAYALGVDAEWTCDSQDAPVTETGFRFKNSCVGVGLSNPTAIAIFQASPDWTEAPGGRSIEAA